MQWSSYTVFSVISGVVLVVLALTPDSKPKERFWCLVGGAFSIAYGIYVAKQTSGTYTFSAGIFIIPFYAAFRLIRYFARASKASAGAQPPVLQSPVASPAPVRSTPRPAAPSDQTQVTQPPVTRRVPVQQPASEMTQPALRPSPYRQL